MTTVSRTIGGANVYGYGRVGVGGSGLSLVVVFNTFPALAAELGHVAEQALDKGVVTLRATADRLTPRDTGRLATEVVVTAGPGTREVLWAAPYAGFVEKGTYKMEAQPFAGPGVDAAIPVIDAELARFGR